MWLFLKLVELSFLLKTFWNSIDCFNDKFLLKVAKGFFNPLLHKVDLFNQSAIEGVTFQSLKQYLKLLNVIMHNPNKINMYDILMLLWISRVVYHDPLASEFQICDVKQLLHYNTLVKATSTFLNICFHKIGLSIVQKL